MGAALGRPLAVWRSGRKSGRYTGRAIPLAERRRARAAGAGGFRPAAVPGAGPVVLWADGDKTGTLAAVRLGAALRARGRDVRVRTLRRVKGERPTMAKDDGKRARALAALRKHAPALKRLSADPADLADLGFTEADRAALADLGAALADLPDADLGAALADLPDLGGDHGDP